MGVELDEVLAATARRRLEEELRTWKEGRRRRVEVNIIAGDALEAIGQIQRADIIMLFLVPSCLEMLAPIFKAKCKRNVRIITYQFPLPDWEPWATEEAPHHLLSKEVAKERKSRVFAYRLES